jgi:cob(I)alamin adenosyltransferase
MGAIVRRGGHSWCSRFGRVSIATKRGDAGRTSLLYGGRVRKDSVRIDCNGAVDEAQSALGLARALIAASSASGPPPFSTEALVEIVVGIERDLWVLMAEVATSPRHRAKLLAGQSLVTPAMVEGLTALVDRLEAAEVMPKEFVVPGQSVESAALDVARAIVRRAERLAVAMNAEGSHVVPYLNRLSDVCWLLGRSLEGEHLTARPGGRRRRPAAQPAAPA